MSNLNWEAVTKGVTLALVVAGFVAKLMQEIEKERKQREYKGFDL